MYKSKNSIGNFRIAPYEMLREDFRELTSRIVLRTALDVEQLLLIPSVTSHAHIGANVFHGRRYPNTTEDDTVRALRLNTDLVKLDRQNLIDEVKDYATRVMAGESIDTLTNRKGECLMRIGLFRYLDIDPKGIVQGLFLGGLRDEAGVRHEAEKRYNAKIGSGKSHLVNKKVMSELNLSGDILAKEAHENKIEEFKKSGLIVDQPGEDVASMYIRYVAGPGASDDAAILMAGKLFGLSAAIGVFLADAIDTLEKYTKVHRDQDSDLARFIEQQMPNLGMNRDDAYLLTYLAAVPEGEERVTPDNSVRGFLQVDRKHDLCALESHLLYLMGKPTPMMEIDQGKCTNMAHYRYIESRIAALNI